MIPKSFFATARSPFLTNLTPNLSASSLIRSISDSTASHVLQIFVSVERVGDLVILASVIRRSSTPIWRVTAEFRTIYSFPSFIIWQNDSIFIYLGIHGDAESVPKSFVSQHKDYSRSSRQIHMIFTFFPSLPCHKYSSIFRIA